MEELVLPTKIQMYTLALADDFYTVPKTTDWVFKKYYLLSKPPFMLLIHKYSYLHPYSKY